MMQSFTTRRHITSAEHKLSKVHIIAFFTRNYLQKNVQDTKLKLTCNKQTQKNVI